MRRKTRPTTVPVVMASMARPFAEVMIQRGRDPSALLTRFGIRLDDLSADDIFISAQDWYDFVQAVSDELAEPYLGFWVGHEAVPGTLPNMRLVDLASSTCGDVLNALVIDANRITTLASYTMSNNGQLARLESARVFEPTKKPSQMDGFFTGFMLRMLREFTAGAWNPRALRIAVCDRDAIPPDALPRRSLVKGNLKGATFTFPARWLLMRLEGDSRHASIGVDRLNKDFAERLRYILRARLADPGMSIKIVARLTSHSVGQLQNKLLVVGTTYSHEINSMRMAKARELLASSTLSISSVGEAVGYPDPPSFSRAFKTWAGISPREFRTRAKEQ